MKLYTSLDTYYDFVVDMEFFQTGVGLKQSGQVFLLIGGTELNPRISLVYGQKRGVLHPDAGNVFNGEIPSFVKRRIEKLQHSISKEPSNAK